MATVQEVLAIYDDVTKNAPTDDVEWDFVMTAADYRVLRAVITEVEEREKRTSEMLARDAARNAAKSGLCTECHGHGLTDNHVTGEVECGSCCGEGHA